MELLDIMNKMVACHEALTKGSIQLKTLGLKKAQAEHDYRIALAKEELKLRREDKFPATLIYDVAKGKENIAKLRLDRDVAETDYNVCLEAMRNIRLELEAYRSFIK